MMTRYVGPRAVFLRPICKGGYFNRGEGIAMALDIGAAGRRRVRQLPRRADRPALRRVGAVGLHLPLRHPGEQGGPPLHGRGAGHGGRALRARDAPHLRAAGRHRLGGPRRAAHPHPELPPGHPHRQAAGRGGLAPGAGGGAGTAGRRPAGDGRGVQRRVRAGRRVPAAGAGRPRDAGARSAQVELGRAAGRAALPRLPDHVGQRVHLRRPAGGSPVRACWTGTASPIPGLYAAGEIIGTVLPAPTPARRRC